LLHQLYGLFVSSEILHCEEGVRGNYDHKTQVAEVEALGYYLCAYEYVGLSRAEVPDCLFFEGFVLGGIAVKSGYAA
jgi:hypothetical protein